MAATDAKVNVIGFPDPRVAAKLAEAATERGADQVAAYLTEVADFLKHLGGQAIIPVEPGDEVLVRRTHHMGTIPHPKTTKTEADPDGT